MRVVGIFSWNNLSVKQKLFGLVLLPILLLLVLAGKHVQSLSIQAQELQKAQLFSVYIDRVSSLYHLPNNPDVIDKQLKTQQISQLLRDTAAPVFGENAEILNQLISFEEATLSMLSSQNQEEKLDAAEWRADTFKEILMSLDKVYFRNVSYETNTHLSSLMQLEWLMFWSTEEHRLSESLIRSSEENNEYDLTTQASIQSLIQNQQLFLERFVTLNANQQQVDLLIETFTGEVFIKSQEFRAYLLQPAQLKSLTPDEIDAGLSALNKRLSLLQSVDDKMEQQLSDDISKTINTTTQHRFTFIAMMSLLTLLVVSLTLRLVRKVTGNLNLVLKFLSNESNEQSNTENSPLAQLIKGKDELSKFAREVKKLSDERMLSRLKLTQAKEDAEQAKDDAIKASKAKSSFLANMSHEIRTPLNGVIGISEVLSDTSLTATQRDYVDTIETSSQLLLSLINDVLDFSKIESGMLLISPHSTCVRESIYDIASIISPKAKEKGIDVQVNISRNTPYHVMLDDHRIRQVVMNFMSNAVKFTEQGSVELSVITREIKNGEAVIEFSVKDSGIGIDAQQQKKIFAPFAQEDNSTTRQFGGTGLGLAISTQLVELMGGEIQLESEKGKGSRFFFELTAPVVTQEFNAYHALNHNDIWIVCSSTQLEQKLRNELSFFNINITQSVDTLSALPTWIDNERVIVIHVEASPNAAAMHIDEIESLCKRNIRVCLIKHLHSPQFDFRNSISALVTQPLLGQRLIKALESCAANFSHAQQESTSAQHVKSLPKILVVDDNTVNQKIAGLHVTKAGFDFDVAVNGQEAVEKFQQNQYSLILMDCMMPVMDGFEATQIIRQIEVKEKRAFRIPIIALTASVVDDDIQKCFDVGMDDYVPKPFKAGLLKEKLDKAIGLRVSNTTPAEPHQENTTPDKTHKLPASSEQPEATVTPIRSERILLVEDNRVNQKVASLLLSKAGYQFEVAENGQIAVEMFQKDGKFDVILMDCMMPIMDGFEASRQIRAYEASKGLAKTPIIALTASVVDDDIQRCFDSGMDAYVPKPVRKEKLLYQIEQAM
ncbi:response regulator [Vibrio alginolyticus]|uniref:response regulator n=1 Tax=Vibrio alginolyticus TaxID=663 RepID=UPI001BD6C514|nr:response regulator [Vibrio alginolyticus]MBS9870369.1 response regulator [Vibrio alginolyticus]HCZ9286160.1 response regulator [Vibrio alginolyticus]